MLQAEMSWYLLNTRPRMEFGAEVNLNMRRITTFLPLTLPDKRTGATKPIPYFSRYLFFRMEEGTDNFHMVSKTPGVVSIVRMTPDEYGDYRPTKVHDELIQTLKNSQNERGIIAVDNDYKPGDAVRIKSGAFHDIQAIVDAKTGDDRVMVLLTMLGGQKRVEVNYTQIEPAT